MPDNPPESAADFVSISEMDSASLLKPHLPLLVVTATPDRGPNVMTAAWWMIAGYRPFRYLLSVDQKTFTYELLEEHPEFVMAIPTVQQIDAVALCGLTSGRDVDKIDQLGLDLLPATEVEVPLIRSALGNIECRVDDSFESANNTYYFGSVVAAHARPDALDGRLLDLEAVGDEILAYMGSDFAEPGDSAKSRFYLDLERSGLRSFPDESVLADSDGE